MPAILFLLLCHVGEPTNVVSAIECNTVVNENGSLYDQYIFWRNTDVVDWRPKSCIKHVSYSGGFYHMTWREQNKIYKVKSRVFIVTATFEDRELRDRKKNKGRGLYAEQLFRSE